MKHLLLFAAMCCLLTPVSARWINQNAGFTNKNLGFYEISIVDRNTVWAICYDGINGLFGSAHVLDFTRTTNGGTTWTPGKMGSDSTLAFSNISAVSATEAWVAMHRFDLSTGGGLFHTTDGGVTWTQSGVGQIFDSASFPNFVYFKDPLNGVAGGDANGGYFEIYTTSNGGATWIRTPQANVPPFVTGGNGGWFDGYAVVGDTIWFGNSKSQMYKSTDFGKTWAVYTMSTTGNQVYEIAFNDDGQHGLAHIRGAQTMLFATSDGGLTWTQRATHPKWKQSRITSVPGTHRFVSTSMIPSGKGSSYTDDYGITWIDIESVASKAACRFLDSTTGWAGGFFNDIPGYPISGGMYKWDVSQPAEVGNTAVVHGLRVYPNPATGNLFVKIDGKATMHHLEFINSGGVLVKTFNMLASGEVDISELPGGIYFIKDGNDLTQQLKFIKQD